MTVFSLYFLSFTVRRTRPLSFVLSPVTARYPLR
jgi:hypothetical protein